MELKSCSLKLILWASLVQYSMTGPSNSTNEGPTYGRIITVTKELIQNDTTGILDVSRLIKNPVNGQKYQNGKTCDLGQDPWTSKEVDRILELANDLEEFQVNGNGARAARLNLSSGQQQTLNDGATKKYGANCDNGNCYYDQKRNSYICSSQMLKPIVFLFVGITVLHFVLPRINVD